MTEDGHEFSNLGIKATAHKLWDREAPATVCTTEPLKEPVSHRWVASTLPARGKHNSEQQR